MIQYTFLLSHTIKPLIFLPLGKEIWIQLHRIFPINLNRRWLQFDEFRSLIALTDAGIAFVFSLLKSIDSLRSIISTDLLVQPTLLASVGQPLHLGLGVCLHLVPAGGHLERAASWVCSLQDGSTDRRVGQRHPCGQLHRFSRLGS